MRARVTTRAMTWCSIPLLVVMARSAAPSIAVGANGQSSGSDLAVLEAPGLSTISFVISETTGDHVPARKPMRRYVMGPGAYRVAYGRVAVLKGTSISITDVVSLEASRRYRVKGESRGFHITAWIEDLDTGEVVSGFKWIGEVRALPPPPALAGIRPSILAPAKDCLGCVRTIADASSGVRVYDRERDRVIPKRWVLAPGTYLVEYGMAANGGAIPPGDPPFRSVHRADRIEMQPGHEYAVGMVSCLVPGFEIVGRCKGRRGAETVYIEDMTAGAVVAGEKWVAPPDRAAP